LKQCIESNNVNVTGILPLAVVKLFAFRQSTAPFAGSFDLLSKIERVQFLSICCQNGKNLSTCFFRYVAGVARAFRHVPSTCCFDMLLGVDGPLRSNCFAFDESEHCSTSWKKSGRHPLLKCPFPWRIWTQSSLIHGSLGPTPQTASRSVQPFCMAHQCYWKHRQTTPYYICNSRMDRVTVMMRRGLKSQNAFQTSKRRNFGLKK